LTRSARSERFLCLINAPPDGDVNPYPDREVKTCMSRALNTLERCGVTLHPADEPKITTPADFAALFPGSGGAIYGRASHGWMSTFLRAGNRSRLPGLYLAGGSVHPGPGVPMAALSGRLAASALLQDWTSGSKLSRVAMPGGISMR
jgi:1-hydroxycarotenoid 3,4-desaturase